MPKGQKPASVIPRDMRFAILEGQDFIRVREAAKLAGIPLPVLEMGKKMLENLQHGARGVSIPFVDDAMRRNRDSLISELKQHLRRYAKALEPNRKLRLKMFVADGQRVVAWYQPWGK